MVKPATNYCRFFFANRGVVRKSRKPISRFCELAEIIVGGNFMMDLLDQAAQLIIAKWPLTFLVLAALILTSGKAHKLRR
jgi:hypothetical protein